MISPGYFVDELLRNGIEFFSGVPCSFLTPLINEVSSRIDTNYTIASSEGEAVALAAGAWLGGKIGVVLCQNSGLGNMVNPLTSLNAPFSIPVLLLVTWRGKPGQKDEPQHKLMGEIMLDLLKLMQIEFSIFPKEQKELLPMLAEALYTLKELQKPYAFIIEEGTFSNGLHSPQKLTKTSQYPSRQEILNAAVNCIPTDSPIIVTTGKSGRELYTLHDADNHLYCVGSMGYANALAHGLALVIKKRVFIIDGDGAAIMHLGNFASIGAKQAKNLVHIVLDNSAYESTGGQATVSQSVNFCKIAEYVGYQIAIYCDTLQDFILALKTNYVLGPIFIHVKINSDSMKNLGRPEIKPYAVARRLRDFVENSTY